MESEFFIESLGLNLISFVKINNLPSLVSSIVWFPSNDLSSFFISSTMYIKCFTVGPVDELSFLVLEELPPIRVGAPDLHFVGLSRVLDVP